MEDLNRHIDILPQQFPFRMIDEIIDYQEGKSLTAVKNITGSEWVFEGIEPGKQEHFPETLIIEAAAQAALIFHHLVEKTQQNQNIFLGKIDSEFTGRARIGERLVLKTGHFRKMEKSGYMAVSCYSNNEQIANVKIFYGLVG